MRTRLVLGTVGVLMGAFGLLRFLQHDVADILDAVLWLAGGVVVHDAVIAPLTLGVAFVATRALPHHTRTIVVTALVVLVTVTITAIPVLGTFGARSDNATLLDRNYTVGWVVLAVAVLVVVAVRLVLARRRLGHGEQGEPVDEEA